MISNKNYFGNEIDKLFINTIEEKVLHNQETFSKQIPKKINIKKRERYIFKSIHYRRNEKLKNKTPLFCKDLNKLLSINIIDITIFYQIYKLVFI